MLYLSKKVDTIEVAVQKPRIDFSNHYTLFGFLRNLTKENLLSLKELLDTKNTQCNNLNTILLADIIAAQTKNFYDDKIFKRDSFVLRSLACCRDILIDNGYIQIDIEKIVSLTHEVEKNIVIVAGNQEEEILGGRVRGSHSLCESLLGAQIEVEVILSGGRPNADRVKIVDESQTMKDMFVSCIEQGLSKNTDWQRLLKLRTLPESMSTNSAENICKSINLIQREWGNKHCNVFIVSSNYHLYRLSKNFEFEQLRQSLKIKNLVLVGAEKATIVSQVSMLDAYVKAMVFEIYWYLISNKDFWK